MGSICSGVDVRSLQDSFTSALVETLPSGTGCWLSAGAASATLLVYHSTRLRRMFTRHCSACRHSAAILLCGPLPNALMADANLTVQQNTSEPESTMRRTHPPDVVERTDRMHPRHVIDWTHCMSRSRAWQMPQKLSTSVCFNGLMAYHC